MHLNANCDWLIHVEGLDEIQHELSEKQKEFEMEDEELMGACEIKKGQVSQARYTLMKVLLSIIIIILIEMNLLN